MIRIGEYGIDAGASEYTVGKIRNALRKKKDVVEGVDVILPVHYFKNIQGCLGWIRKQMHLDAISEYDGDLAGAVSVLREADEMFERLIEGVEKE
jgi:hypothetical protein